MELSLHIAKEHPPQINCDDCAFSALSVHDMEDHVNVQHKVKELLSCNQCDFDSEDGNELEEHYAKGIHVIKVQNQTIKEPKCSKCQLCEFETKGAKEIDEHVINVHGFKSCDKCEYIAEDMVLMNQHKMKHTESSLYTCGVCEFEATKLAMLKDHIEIKHTKQNTKIRNRITFVRNVKRSLRIYLSRDIICVHRKQSMLVPNLKITPKGT